jgi:DNA-binding MarR family transcriptional regulator
LIIKSLSINYSVNSDQSLQNQVLMADRDQGISSVLFRNAIGRKLRLNSTDFECLSLLTIRGTSTPTELARHTGLTTGSTTAMLDRLEKAQFIARKPNPNDRRGVLVEVSKHYREVAAPLVAGVQQAHSELLGKYSEQELTVIEDFLRKFTNNVTEQTKILEQPPE